MDPNEDVRIGTHKRRSEEIGDEDLVYYGSMERKRKRKRILSHVEISQSELIYPQSLYEGWVPPLGCVSEQKAILDLLEVLRHHEQRDEHIMLRLEQFCIYRPDHDKHGFELAPLHHLQVEPGINSLLFDGILMAGEERRYVQRVPFDCLTVDGYGDLDVASLDSRLCLQSHNAKANNVWYQLGDPSPAYQRHYDPFLWIAHFCKYFVEFLIKRDAIGLCDFQKRFFRKTARKYRNNSAFQQWHSAYNRSYDFRRAVAAYVGFLWKEAWSVDPSLCKQHPIWEEVDPQRLKAIKFHEPKETKTIVTPFVYECFNNMAFATELEVRFLANIQVSSARAKRRLAMGLTHPELLRTEPPRTADSPRADGNKVEIRQGDVVFVRKPATGQRWTSSISDVWYAYIQGTRQKDGIQKLDIIWLYEPSDTTLGHGHYPIRNELFLSDNCSCGKDALDASSVLGKIKVRWFATNAAPKAKGEFIVRKKFRTEPSLGAYDFVTLRQADFRCPCKTGHSDMDEVMNKYTIGDTVLVRQTQSSHDHDEVLVPAQILEFLPQQNRVLLRQFVRPSGTTAYANQVLPTEETYTVIAARVVRRCQVRTFSSIRKVSSTPYSRGGSGDLFFTVNDSNSVIHDSVGLPPFHEGTDFSSTNAASEKLSGMGLFCGGGNFDRGLEEGGAVEFRYAVDWASHALHSYRANLPDPERTKLFLGSVNDYLAQAIERSSHDYIATIGDVHLIAAGSPCPGWSRLQRWKDSQRSLRNCSLVASVMSFVDLYMPEYLLLENVPDMANTPRGKKDQNPFSQVLCCLVAMGYQVQQFLMDAWSYGSIQSRSRLFIIATAPENQPFERPPQTHSHPWGEAFRSRNLGWASNGKPFGTRRDEVTPFKFVSVKEGLEDLPYIGDAQAHTCIPFPDHRTPKILNPIKRNMLKQIPTRPYGMSFVQAHQEGRASKPQIDSYQWQNKHASHLNTDSWSRMDPTRLTQCITTKMQPTDAFHGRFVHYDQPRLMTGMEARRGQGFLDNEVIIGSPAQQYHIIGNSVDRNVSFAFGLQLRESWLANFRKARESVSTTTEVKAATQVRKRQELITVATGSVIAGTARNELVARPRSTARRLEATSVEVRINVAKKTTSRITVSEQAVSSIRELGKVSADEVMVGLDSAGSSYSKSASPHSLQSPIVSSRTSPSVAGPEENNATAEQLLALFQSSRNTRASRDPAAPIIAPSDWSKIPERQRGSKSVVAARVSSHNTVKISSHDHVAYSLPPTSSHTPQTVATLHGGLRPREVPFRRRSGRVSGDSSGLVGPRDWSKLVEHLVDDYGKGSGR